MADIDVIANDAGELLKLLVFGLIPHCPMPYKRPHPKVILKNEKTSVK